MNFLKASIAFAASTGTKLLANLLIVKIIAFYVGAEGLGQLGQFMSVMSMVTILAGGGIFTGLLKYVAEFKEDNVVLTRYLASGSLIALSASGVIALLLSIFASQISTLLLGTTEYADVIYVLAGVQALIGANNYAIAIINGFQDVRSYALATMLGSLLGAVGLSVVTVAYGLRGAMYGLILMPTAMVIFSIPYALRQKGISLKNLLPRYDRVVGVKLLHYATMMCVTVSTMPVAQIIIRRLIGANGDWAAVGYWQGITKLSDAYLMFIHVILGNYYLPRLSAKKNKIDLKKEVYGALCIAAPVTALMSFSVFLLRDFIITVLFSESFVPMRDFFSFQMIGDFLKICSYTIGYVCVAKAMTKIYIFAEIVQSLMFIFLAYIFLNNFGPIGITYAFALNYAIYFILSFLLFSYYIKRKNVTEIERNF